MAKFEHAQEAGGIQIYRETSTNRFWVFYRLRHEANGLRSRCASGTSDFASMRYLCGFLCGLVEARTAINDLSVLTPQEFLAAGGDLSKVTDVGWNG